MQRAGSSLTYTELGLQYYIAGRFAALNGLVPVAGNLFHHAIEMVLKAGLLTILTEDQLKCQFGHNLTKLWDSFKDLTQSQALSAFGDVIQELDRWEDLRYFTPPPDPPLGKEGTFFAVPIDSDRPGIQPDSTTADSFEISVEAIDELFTAVVKALASVVVLPNLTSTEYIHMRLSRRGVRDVYQQANKHRLW